jgi:hypothetical protein
MNRLVVTGGPPMVWFEDTNPIDPGPGCTRPGADPNIVVCTPSVGPVFHRMIVLLLDGDDIYDDRSSSSLAWARGGTGNDVLSVENGTG